MSRARMGWGQVKLLAIVASGSLAACGEASKNAATSGGAPASGAGAVAGGPKVEQPRGGAPSDSSGGGALVYDGGRATTGGTASGSGGDAGGARTTGGAGSSGAAADGGTGGEGGVDGGGDAGASGASGAGGKGTLVEPYFHAGSRLKPRVFRVGDFEVLDSIEERSWYDVETDEGCGFRVGADGIERCLPSNLLSGSIEYLDAACTRPAVRTANRHCNGSVLQKYFTIESSSCSYRTYRFGVAGAASTPTYGKTGGSCRRIAPPSEDSATPVWPVEEVPVETFVAVKRVSRARQPGMNAWVREGEDGSWEIVGFSDPARDVPCFGLGLDVSPQVCVPSWVQTFEAFGDATCAQRLAIDDGARCTARMATALLDLRQTVEGCQGKQAITGLWQSAGVRSTPIYSSPKGVCELGQAEPVVAHLQGAPIDLASLPQLDVIEVGNGLLRVPFYGFGGVPFVPAPAAFASGTLRFIEAKSGDICQPYVFADGIWRCVPHASFSPIWAHNVYYESADCTGGRAYTAASAICVYGTLRKPRGIIAQAAEGCTPLPVIDTLEFSNEASSADLVSYRYSPSSTCRSKYVSDDAHLVRMSAVQNLDDLFVPMERKLSD